jgi:hypothetical protein
MRHYSTGPPHARQRFTAASLVDPCTLVVARLPSGSDRRQATRDGSLGSLTTTRDELLGDPPLTTVERVDPLASLVPPSTDWTGTSQTGPVRTLLGTGAPGAHASP